MTFLHGGKDDSTVQVSASVVGYGREADGWVLVNVGSLHSHSIVSLLVAPYTPPSHVVIVRVFAV